MARAQAEGTARHYGRHPLEAEELLLVLAWDRAFAELPAITANDNPLMEYFERWWRAHYLVHAELTGTLTTRISRPLDRPHRWGVLVEGGETPEFGYLIVLHGHMQQHSGARAIAATPALAPAPGARAVVGNEAFDRAFEEVRRLLEPRRPGQGDVDHQIESRNRRYQAFGDRIAEGNPPHTLVAAGIDPAEYYCWKVVCDLQTDQLRTQVPLAPNPLVSYAYRTQCRVRRTMSPRGPAPNTDRELPDLPV